MKHVTYSIAALSMFGSSSFGVTLFGPAPYTSEGDSPYTPISYSWFYLEDFEDGALNTPGVSANAGFVLNPGALTDSVDLGGRSYYAGGGHTTTLTFTFNAGALGGVLPTSAGIVWTDVGFLLDNSLGGPSDVLFEAFDAFNQSLGVIGPVALGDNAFDGDQAEDRFFGMTNAGGISRISITMPNSDDWEVDHLQYGYALPGPASIGALGIAAVLGLPRRRNASGK